MTYEIITNRIRICWSSRKSREILTICSCRRVDRREVRCRRVTLRLTRPQLQNIRRPGCSPVVPQTGPLSAWAAPIGPAATPGTIPNQIASLPHLPTRCPDWAHRTGGLASLELEIPRRSVGNPTREQACWQFEMCSEIPPITDLPAWPRLGSGFAIGTTSTTRLPIKERSAQEWRCAS